MFVCLSEQTEREGSDGVVRPRSIQNGEQSLSILDSTHDLISDVDRACKGDRLTFDSSVLSRLRNPASSGEVIIIKLRF